ncbi:hypothetical protein Tco_1162991 [Tanacetum coccineum]
MLTSSWKQMDAWKDEDEYNKSLRVRWIKFTDAVTETYVKINIEHIEGKHNTLADSLSRLVNLCFAKCTGEMKQLAATTLYSVEEVLQSPNAFQENMKIIYEESPKTLNSQQQKKQSKPCKVYKQSYNAKHKSASACQLKTTTGLTKEKTSKFNTKKPEESSSNWKPLHNDWAATTSKPKEVQAYTPKDNTCHYNKKGIIEDDDNSDDSIFIVDPGWDDYCLQELKLNRPVLCCPDARRAHM